MSVHSVRLEHESSTYKCDLNQITKRYLENLPRLVSSKFTLVIPSESGNM